MPTLTSGDGATWVNDPATELDAGELRRADAAIFTSGGVARGLEVSVTGSDEVRVESGSWVIDGEDTAEGTGVYRAGTSAQVSANLDPRDATYGRIDLVVARQYDPDVVGAHGTYDWTLEVIIGTPSASPSAPALPDLAEEVARLEVPVNGGGAVSVDTSQVRYAATRSSGDLLTAERTANQNLPNGAVTTVGFNTTAERAGGRLSLETGGFVRYNGTRPARATLSAGASFESTNLTAPDSSLNYQLRVNGAEKARTEILATTGTTGGSLSRGVLLQPGDEVSLAIGIGGAGGAAVVDAAGSTFLTVILHD